MTVNALLIGALATLLVFAIVMSNVAFSEKVYTDLTIEKECPYDVMALFVLSEESGVSMDEGREIIEKYSPITAQQDFQLYSLGETTLCNSTFFLFLQNPNAKRLMPREFCFQSFDGLSK